MECNRDDAIRSKEIAERKFRENDIAGAKKFALKAKALFEPLEGICHMIFALDVYLRAQTRIGGEDDWYGILEVAALADEETIKRQYKKLAFQTHPDKNSFIGADGAFKLVSDAWSVLSDKSKRIAYDQRRYMGSLGVHQNSEVNANSTSNSAMSSMSGFRSQNSGPAPPTNVPPSNFSVPSTFWTHCGSCRMGFQYSREYVDRYLKCPVCQKVFVAVEVPPPSAPIYPNGPRPMDANINIGGYAVPDTDRATSGTGVASGSENYDPMLQEWSFLRSAAGAHTTRYPVQQTHDTVRKEDVAAANVARSEEANLGRNVMESVRRHARSCSSIGSSVSAANTILKKGAATKEKEAAKRRYFNDDKNVAWQSTSSGPNGDSDLYMHQAKRKLGSTMGTSGPKRCKVSSGHLNFESSGNAEISFSKALKQLDVRDILIQNTKLQIRDKLEESNSMKANLKSKGKIAVEDNGKELASERVDSEEKERAQSSKHLGLEEKEKTWKWTLPEIRIVYTRRNRKVHKKDPGVDPFGANSSQQHYLDGEDSCLDQEPSSNEGSGEMPVPDADFHNFGDHSESSFQNDQIWAVYDEEDGMPRYYALIRKVLSTHPFKVRLAYLKAEDCNEFGTSDWVSYGYSKTCGDFNVGASKDTDQLNAFSHVVTWEKCPSGIIRIFPKKGDIWALYQNWSPDWNEFTPDDTMYKYELVEVVDSYNPSEGISVMPIVKVPGFVSVFKPLLDPTKSRRIPKKEMLRFSHQVPFHVLTGEEAQNSPKGCYELDPGSTPKELLQVVPQSDDAE